MDSLLQGSRDFLPGWAAGAELTAQFHFTWGLRGGGLRHENATKWLQSGY